MGVLVARDAKRYEIFNRVVPLMAPPLNVMDLKTLQTSARLATPAISLQDFVAELAISFRIELQAWTLGAGSGQSVT
jgi:hypothetical protein